MALTFEQHTALFAGAVTVAEAEALLTWLQNQEQPQFDLSACTHLHAAHLQILLATHARITAWPDDDSLTAWLKPALHQLCKDPCHGQDNPDHR